MEDGEVQLGRYKSIGRDDFVWEKTSISLRNEVDERVGSIGGLVKKRKVQRIKVLVRYKNNNLRRRKVCGVLVLGVLRTTAWVRGYGASTVRSTEYLGQYQKLPYYIVALYWFRH